MKIDLSEMMRQLQEGGGPEALVQRTLAAHGLVPGGVPLSTGSMPTGSLPMGSLPMGSLPMGSLPGMGRAARGPSGDLGMERHRTATPHGTREWLLHRPSQPADRPALVVMIHGCTQSGPDFALGTGMNDAAEAQGWHVIWPEQAREANMMGCWNWFEPAHQTAEAGEPAILAAMIADALDRIGAPEADVFVAGLSSGAAMAAILAETHPGLMLAIGVHSGLPTGAATSMPAAMSAMRGGAAAPGRDSGVPMIVFHGSADSTVAPANGDALSHHIGGTSRAGSDGGRTWQVRKGAGGEYWRIDGLGHAWSGGRPAGSYTDPAGPDATAEMLRFFAQQRR